MMLVACNKSKIIPENPAQEQEMENNTTKHPSQNASWTGWANANKNEIQAYQNKVMEVVKILSRDAQVTQAFKEYFQQNASNPNFDYSINFSDIMQLCQSKNLDIPNKLTPHAVACGMISDGSKIGELIQELKGKTIGGRTITTEIFIPYYDTRFCETPSWDGTIVNRVVLNDIYTQKNVGIPIYVWDGNDYTLEYCKSNEILNQYIQWIIELNVPDNLKPITKCTCVNSIPPGEPVPVDHCVSGGTIGNPLCRLSLGNCEGNCNPKIY
jgi:hypothetical protein